MNNYNVNANKPKEGLTQTFDGIELNVIDGKKDVFVSYKRENASYVERLTEELQAHGINVWFDLNELHYDVGDEYTKRIQHGINNSDYFLLIYTKEVEKSDFIIEKELGYATKENKIILFYPKEEIDINSSKLKEYVGKIQWLDTEATAVYQQDTQESIGDEKHLADLSAMINEKHGKSVYEDQSLFLIRIALQRKLGKITVFGNYKKICGAEMNGFYEDNHFKMTVVKKALFISASEERKKRLEELNFFRKDKQQEVEKLLEKVSPDENELMDRFKNFIVDHKDIYTMPILHNKLKDYLNVEKYRSVKLPSSDNFNVQQLINVVADMVACSFISDLESGKTMFNGAELGVYSIKDNRTTNSEQHCVDMQLYYSDYFTFKCMTEMYHVLCSIDGSPFKINNNQDIQLLAPFLCSLGLGGFVVSYIKGHPYLMWTKRAGNISSGDIWHFSYDETVSLLLDGKKDTNGNLIINEDKNVEIDCSSILFRALKEEVGATKHKVKEGGLGLFEVGIIRSERLEIELISQAVLCLQDAPSPEEQIKEMHDSANDGYLEIAKVQFLPLGNRKALIGKLLTPEAYAIFARMQGRLIQQFGNIINFGINSFVEEGSFVDDSAEIGDNCRIHRNVYIGKNVKIGNKVKIQNNNSIYEGVTLEDGVFIGTNVSFINDRYPRAIMRDGRQVVPNDWNLEETRICYGASIGAGSVIMCGVTIGKWAMVAAGSVVLEDVPDYAMVAGNPSRVIKRNIEY